VAPRPTSISAQARRSIHVEVDLVVETGAFDTYHEGRIRHAIIDGLVRLG
jgi:hypothetical protein